MRPGARLSPHGTAREQFDRLRRHDATGDPLARLFRRLAAGARMHDLGDDSLYLAEELVRLSWSVSQAEQRALALVVLASMISVRQGSSRLPLSGGADDELGKIVSSIVRAGGLEVDSAAVLADIGTLTRSVTFDRLIGNAGEYLPLVVADDCLYQERMFRCEQAFVQRLRERLASAAEHDAAGSATVADAVAEVVDSAPFPLSDEQQRAIERAVRSRYTLITGGPGSGKTAIVVSALRALVRLGVDPNAIALAAPTGKAVNRLATATLAGLQSLPSLAAPDQALLDAAPKPQTVHRLLGYIPGHNRFRHHENNPIPAEVIIVDEASMIGLALMERLLRAAAPTARLVLLGDADQLPSVEAGAVLRDLVAALPGFTTRLTRSYRMNPANPAGRAILGVAEQIKRGRSPLPLKPDDEAGVTFVDTQSAPARVTEFIDAWYRDRITAHPDYDRLVGKTYRFRDGKIDPGDRGDLEALLAHYESSCLLAVTRRYSAGSEAVNRRLHDHVLKTSTLDHRPDLYPGEPILMRQNDYERGLFNGDRGVVLRVTDDDGPQHFRAVFPRPDGHAVFHLDALRSRVELAFALTIHKSQGSEYDHVAVLIPTIDLPLLSREMLYTAITRARSSVTLVGSEPLIRIASNRSIERFSGLRDRLTDG